MATIIPFNKAIRAAMLEAAKVQPKMQLIIGEDDLRNVQGALSILAVQEAKQKHTEFANELLDLLKVLGTATKVPSE